MPEVEYPGNVLEYTRECSGAEMQPRPLEEMPMNVLQQRRSGRILPIGPSAAPLLGLLTSSSRLDDDSCHRTEKTAPSCARVGLPWGVLINLPTVSGVTVKLDC